jgi:hypothetical protein
MGVLGLLVIAPALAAPDDTKPAKKPASESASKSKADSTRSAAQQYNATVAEYDKAMQAFFQEYSKAKTQEERQKIYEKKYPKVQDYSDRIMELVRKHPKDAFAVQALVWVFQHRRGQEAGREAQAILLRDYVASAEIAPVCQMMAYDTSPDAEKTLKSILEKNKHHEVLGQARMSLAQHCQIRAEYDTSLSDKEKQRLTKEAEAAAEEVAAKYADIKDYRGTLGKAAKSMLFELRNLAIGKQAPEIAGEDLDGKKFKLSDYRGKVVVLDFWGNW